LRWVIGWITGLFGATTGGTEQLQIMPDSYIDVANKRLYLHVVNKGGTDVVIYKVSTGVEDVDTDITVTAGDDTTLEITLTKTYNAGASYTVKVYTKNGNVFTATVVAKQS